MAISKALKSTSVGKDVCLSLLTVTPAPCPIVLAFPLPLHVRGAQPCRLLPQISQSAGLRCSAHGRHVGDSREKGKAGVFFSFLQLPVASQAVGIPPQIRLNRPSLVPAAHL